MISADELAWAIASGLFAAGWAMTAFFARRDRSRIQEDISQLSQRIDSLMASIDGLRGEIQRMAIEHERRLVRIETLIDGR